MSQLKIKQLKSVIKRNQQQKDTIVAMGLGRPNYTAIMPDNPQTRGMIHVVKHLVEFEEIA
jgi:large subunit ribosomal protein L30